MKWKLRALTGLNNQRQDDPFLKISSPPLYPVTQVFLFLFWPHLAGTWDLSSPIKNQIRGPCIGSVSLNCWITRKSTQGFLKGTITLCRQHDMPGPRFSLLQKHIWLLHTSWGNCPIMSHTVLYLRGSAKAGWLQWTPSFMEVAMFCPHWNRYYFQIWIYLLHPQCFNQHHHPQTS